ncbi:MAG: ETC complex I subunit [Parvularcula sp.]
MFATIYRPSKTAMQSGRNKADGWVLEFERETPRRTDPLMGWTAGGETTANQVHLHFATKEEAIAYARQHKLPHQVIDSAPTKPVIKAYSDNFAFRRRMPWTH